MAASLAAGFFQSPLFTEPWGRRALSFYGFCQWHMCLIGIQVLTKLAWNAELTINTVIARRWKIYGASEPAGCRGTTLNRVSLAASSWLCLWSMKLFSALRCQDARIWGLSRVSWKCKAKRYGVNCLTEGSSYKLEWWFSIGSLYRHNLGTC